MSFNEKILELSSIVDSLQASSKQYDRAFQSLSLLRRLYATRAFQFVENLTINCCGTKDCVNRTPDEFTLPPNNQNSE